MKADNVRYALAAVVLVAAVSLTSACGGSGEPVATPTQLAPDDGAVFDVVPREVTLRWTSTGADVYLLEVQVCQPQGCSDDTATVLNVPLYHHDTSYFLRFPAARPGRWRVAGSQDSGAEGPKSPWRVFYFTR